MRDPAQADLEWDGYLFLDFFSGSARVKSYDLNLRIRNVGERLNRQRSECRNTSRDEQSNQEDQKERLIQSERNKTSDHLRYFPPSPLLSNRAPLVTTRSFEASPCSITV